MFAVVNNTGYNGIEGPSQLVFDGEMEVEISNLDGITNYQISAGEYKITKDESGFSIINMLTPGYGIIDSPGDPALPEKMLEFKVPQNIDWSTLELSFDVLNTELLSGSYEIAPNPPFVAKDSSNDFEYEFWGEGKNIVDGKNMNIYGMDSNYPEEPVELLPYTERKESTESGYENMKYVRIAYRPFLYNPISKELTFIQKVNININYETFPSSLRGTRAGPYDYVIITKNNYVDNSEMLEYFVTLKEVAGHDVLVITEDDYGGLTGQAPNETPEKIRQWLINNDISYDIDYVLLIGDPDPDDPSDPNDHVGDVPMKWCMPNYFGHDARENPTDYFYADLTGNWDLDGDEIFGECLDVNNPTSPAPMIINSDYFSVRWTGYIECDFNEEYKFQTFSDGGVKLYIDGNLEIDNWDTLTEHPPTNDYATLTMTSGLHDIKIEYKEHDGDGIIKLFWRTTAPKGDPNFLDFQTVPLDHLWNESGTANGLTGEYYNNIYLVDPPDLVNPDGEVINFIWGTGDKGSGGPDTGADVFVGRIPIYNNNYTQLDKILEKIIKYECEAGSLAWRKSIILPMDPLWDDTPAYHLGEGIRNDYALAAGFNCFRIYEEDYSSVGGPTPELWPCNINNVKNEWKNGYGMMVWDTHGDPYGAEEVFHVDYIPELDDTKPAFTYMVACTNSHPETPGNLGQALLVHGAINTVGATRVSYGAHGAWTFDSTSAVNHNLAYFYTKKIIVDGMPAGEALYRTKGDVAEIGSNLLNYNLYGDPDNYLLVTVPNEPPVADVNGPYEVDEGTSVSFDGSGSYDPDNFPFPLEYRWDFENDGIWDTTWSTDPTATYTWSDDYSGDVALEVTDGILLDSDSNTVTVKNVVPSITPFGPFFGDEPYLVDITTYATDPGSDDLTFTWEFDFGPTITTIFYNDGIGPDPADSYVGGNYPFTVTDSASREYGDNGNYSITLTVEDDNGGVAVYTTYAIIDNVAPTIENIEAYILVNFTLRAAGEKWHNVNMSIQENDVEIGFAEVVRYPGSPDDQSITLYNVKCDVTKYINVTVLYTPMDDPINGQIYGATPVWVTLDFEDGEDVRLHHTCNVRHPDTWEWNFGVNKFFVGHNITFESDASDPGSDDLTFDWFWDDSTSNTITTYYNNDVSPDPYPSPDGIYPFSAHDETKHMFMTKDCFDVQLTVTDDDGEADVIVVIVIIV
ncbi:MAG: hypothetical protein A7315_04965 [Candidatus Altiarchaeales archaeon WOR_SM1_79]|nr:MAG: hypothetical protein A7315_04965 [Candidatus Altiarchaeales archaeon WOR_SM1_79]